MKYVLLLNEDGIAISKSICYIDLADNEIEITEEQHNQMNEFPLKLTIEDGKVVSWEKTEIELETAIEQQREPTLEEEVAELKQLVADLASLQLGV